jgi:hypothetical protein
VSHRGRAGALGVLVLALAVQVALPAPAGAVPAAGVALARTVPAGPRQRALPRGRRAGLEARVATLTRALGLDLEQQVAVRRALQDQRQRVQRIWSDRAASAADRVAATRQASTHTADQIRAVLSEEQRKKYDPPAQTDPGRTVGSAHVEDWMKGEAQQ